jgi:hypothetical protein
MNPRRTPETIDEDGGEFAQWHAEWFRGACSMTRVKN